MSAEGQMAEIVEGGDATTGTPQQRDETCSICGIIFILVIVFVAVIVVAIVINAYDDADVYKCYDWEGGELSHYTQDIASEMIDEFDLTINEENFRHSFHLCFMNLSIDYREHDERIIPSSNYSYCFYYCKNNVFGFNSSSLSEENRNMDDDWWKYKPHYYYYNSKDEMCYCQGYIGVIGDSDDSYSDGYIVRGIENAIDTLWMIYEYEYEYEYDLDNATINLADLVNVSFHVNVFGNGDAICDSNKGDIWINYTDINDLYVGYYKYGTWDCESGRPYVIQDSNGQQVSIVANSRVYQCDNNSKDSEKWWWRWRWNQKKRSNLSVEQKKSDLTMTDQERSFVVNAWYNQGLKEHASIASFSVNGIKLLSIGAPAYLLKMNYQASLDEIEHTKICLTISHYYNSTSISSNSDDDNKFFKIPSSLGQHSIEIKNDNFDNWNQIAIETAKHGCIDETLSVLLSYYQSMMFTNDVAIGDHDNSEYDFKSLLNKIAIDESKHASFAWNTLKWMQTYKSSKLDVFKQQWWQEELKTRIGRVSQLSGDITWLESMSLSSFGILSSNQERKVFLVGLKQMIPQLLNKCLLNQQSVENMSCPINVINQFINQKALII